MDATKVHKAESIGTMTGAQFEVNRKNLDLTRPMCATLMGVSTHTITSLERSENKKKPVKPCYALAMVALAGINQGVL